MTFFTYSLGCKVNSYECDAIASKLLEEGFTLDESHPDVIVINTCSVTHVADQKSRQHIRKYRKEFPNAVIAVMGCYAQGNAEFIIKECGADIVIGTSYRDKLVSMIKEHLSKKYQEMSVDDEPRKYCYEELGNVTCSENIRAYLKIQDGCDNFCSYCLIPYRRGRSRSRDYHKVLEEAKSLADKGYKEIVLTGIHIGQYGQDINVKFSYLLEQLCQIDNIYRIRISSLEESEIDDKFIALIADNPKIAKHLHIPMQSGSNHILTKMRRRYTREQFIAKLKYIKSLLPDICFTTDLIVGFPGESEEDFLDSISLIKEVGFNQIHVFPYSPRDNTVAATFKEQIDPKVKADRVNRILELSKSQWDEYQASWNNKKVDVIIERYDNKTKSYVGHSSNYLLVNIKDDNLKVGDIVTTTYKY